MRFVVLGDLHYTDYPATEDSTGRDYFFETLFKKVAAQQPDLVFAVGDIVQEGNHSEIQGLYNHARQQGVELISITGNHDTGSLPKAELRPYFVGGRATGDELYLAFSQAGVRFVLLDTAREMQCDVDWSGYVSAAQQTWLAEQTTAFNRQTGDEALVVMGHHPIYATTDASTVHRLNIENSAEVRQALGQVEAGRALYVCGHNHTNSIVGPDDTGWTYVQCGAPLVAYSFRLITVEASRIQVETVDFGRDDPTILAAMPAIQAGLPHFSNIPVEKAGGQLSDRSWEWVAAKPATV